MGLCATPLASPHTTFPVTHCQSTIHLMPWPTSSECALPISRCQSTMLCGLACATPNEALLLPMSNASLSAFIPFGNASNTLTVLSMPACQFDSTANLFTALSSEKGKAANTIIVAQNQASAQAQLSFEHSFKDFAGYTRQFVCMAMPILLGPNRHITGSKSVKTLGALRSFGRSVGSLP